MPHTLNPQSIRRLVVRGPNWIGDAVMCTSALEGLRRGLPDTEICLLARPSVASLFQDEPTVDAILVEERQGRHRGVAGRFRLARELRAQHFDCAVLLPNSFDAAFTVFLAGIPRRFGYAADGRSFLLTDPVPRPIGVKRLHQVQYYEELVRPLCPPHYVFQPPALHVSEKTHQEATNLLASSGIAANCLLVGINPGSMYGKAKRWLPSRFAEAADEVLNRLKASAPASRTVRGLIVGGPGEEALGEEIARGMRQVPVVLSGKTSIGVLKGLIQRCRVFLTNDTGPMHIANALGVPVVAIFGPTDPATTSPFSPGSVVVRTPVDCSPCLLRECPIDHRCMTGVTVEQVVQAAEQCLSQQENRQGSPQQVKFLC